MIPPFDIFRVEKDGELVWLETAQTLSDARLRITTLKAHVRSDYVIYSQQTGRKSIIRQNDSHELPICPKHDTFMVPHAFQHWELALERGQVPGYRCANLECSIVYIETADGFNVLANGKLTKLPPRADD